MSELDTLRIDFMMLADGAQAVGGKVYVLGGGWTHLFVPDFPGPARAPFALAIGMMVPWHLTNRRFSLTLELTDADGNSVGDSITGEFEQGRPPGLRPGTDQRVLLAVGAQPEFPVAGRYAFNAIIDGERLETTAFEVVQEVPAPTVEPRP